MLLARLGVCALRSPRPLGAAEFRSHVPPSDSTSRSPQPPASPPRLSRRALNRLDAHLSGPRAARQVRQAVRGNKRIVVGPWLSEVGFEVLYWLPFLAWVADRHGIEPGRLTAISRGGAGIWYGGLAGTYLDAFERWEPGDLKDAQHARARSRRQSQKQLELMPDEHRLVDALLTAHEIDPRGTTLLHPSALYLAFRGFWEGWRTIGDVTGRTLNRPLPLPDADPGLGLPDDYVAVKIYFSDCFPNTPANRSASAELLRRLSENGNVVLLTTGLDLDDHTEMSGVDQERVFDISGAMLPTTNLAVQTRAIAGARAFIGTYGGFSYLAPFLGVPAVSIYTEHNFIESHLDVMRHAVPALRAARPRADFAVHALHEDIDLPTLAAAGAAS